MGRFTRDGWPRSELQHGSLISYQTTYVWVGSEIGQSITNASTKLVSMPRLPGPPAGRRVKIAVMWTPGVNPLVRKKSPRYLPLCTPRHHICLLVEAYTPLIIRCLEHKTRLVMQGSKLRGAEGQNAPKLSPNAPRLLNLGAKFCYPIQPDICFEA